MCVATSKPKAPYHSGCSHHGVNGGVRYRGVAATAGYRDQKPVRSGHYGAGAAGDRAGGKRRPHCRRQMVATSTNES